MKSGWQILINAIWRKPVATLDRAAGSLHQWFATPLGEAILARELPLIADLREDQYAGLSLVASAAGPGQIGTAGTDCLEILLYPGLRSLRCDPAPGGSALVANLEEIPLPDNSLDFVLLHHVLEFSENPHDVLREAVRLLAPRGHLLIVGFNPGSLLGLRGAIERQFRLSVPWAHHRLSRTRLTDWLYLMSCEPLGTARGFYTLPVQNRWLRRIFGVLEPLAIKLGLPGAGFFMIHATKDVFGRIARSKETRQVPRLMPIGLPSPAARVTPLHRRKPNS